MWINSVIGNTVNLCDSCKNSFPECSVDSKDLAFCDGEGYDNICFCPKYECGTLNSLHIVASKSVECEDAVSRQAAIYLINKQKEHLEPDVDMLDEVGNAACRICAEIIERLPSVTPKPRTGKWVCIGEQTGALGISYMELKCSRCGWSHSLNIIRNYCPNCGAKMEG